MRRFLGVPVRNLRNCSTDAERLLWQHLKNSRLAGVKFRRQEQIENFIVDFVSFKKRLVVELDGGQHVDNAEYDRNRDRCLVNNGFVVLRFWDDEVLKDAAAVLEVIRQHLR